MRPMKKTIFLKKGLTIIAKFILVGLLALAVIVLFKNRNDILSIRLSEMIAFILGGFSIAFSSFKELKSLIRENNTLQRKLKKAEREIDYLNKALGEIPVNSLIDFTEASNKINRTA